MPQKPVEGTGQVNAELPVELLDELKRFAKSRGEKVREVIEMALRRHMANPPPPTVPVPPPISPLPPMTVGETATGTPTAKKASKRGKK